MSFFPPEPVHNRKWDLPGGLTMHPRSERRFVRVSRFGAFKLRSDSMETVRHRAVMTDFILDQSADRWCDCTHFIWKDRK
jgi:hypothetical protein